MKKPVKILVNGNNWVQSVVDRKYWIACSIWKWFVHEGDYIFSQEAQWMSRFQMQIPIQMFENIWTDIRPFVTMKLSAINFNWISSKLFNVEKILAERCDRTVNTFKFTTSMDFALGMDFVVHFRHCTARNRKLILNRVIPSTCEFRS